MAQIKYLKRSILSLVYDALFIYIGNKQVLFVTFSNEVFGIMHLIGNEIVVRLKSPVSIFLPISRTISPPIFLRALTIYLFLSSFPPSLCASRILGSSFESKNLKFPKYCQSYFELEISL